MKTLLRIAYFALLYGLLAVTSRAEGSASPWNSPPDGGTEAIVRNESVPEPGATALVSLLVVLLALQRQR